LEIILWKTPYEDKQIQLLTHLSVIISWTSHILKHIHQLFRSEIFIAWTLQTHLWISKHPWDIHHYTSYSHFVSFFPFRSFGSFWIYSSQKRPQAIHRTLSRLSLKLASQRAFLDQMPLHLEADARTPRFEKSGKKNEAGNQEIIYIIIHNITYFSFVLYYKYNIYIYRPDAPLRKIRKKKRNRESRDNIYNYT